MSSGSYYVPTPYVPVESRAIGQNEITVPSGATLIQGTYFGWDSNGFSGKTWLLDVGINGSHPFLNNSYQTLSTEQEIQEYFTTHQNLNDIFSNWNLPDGEIGYYTYMAFANQFMPNAPAESCAVFNIQQ